MKIKYKNLKTAYVYMMQKLEENCFKHNSARRQIKKYQSTQSCIQLIGET